MSRYICLCGGRGWVRGPTESSFPRKCVICLGRGNLSEYRIRGWGLLLGMPCPPYGEMGKTKARRFLEAYAKVEELFRLQSEVTEWSHILLMEPDRNWESSLTIARKDMRRLRPSR